MPDVLKDRLEVRSRRRGMVYGQPALRRGWLWLWPAAALWVAASPAPGFSAASAARFARPQQASTRSFPTLSGAYQHVHLLDLEGQSIQPLAGTDALAAVFVFTRSDCPISNAYAPELQRLYREFSSRGVTFWLVFVDPQESAEAIRRHLKDYDYPFGALRDPTHDFVRLTGAQVTPEAAVFVPKAARQGMIYRGRIDDKYVDFGKERPEPSIHDLERVLEAIVSGKAPQAGTTRAVGCFISDLESR